jgi:hypothetical protein
MPEPARSRSDLLANRDVARSRAAVSGAVRLIKRRHVDLARVSAQGCPR